MKRSMLLVLALTAAAYAVLFVYCGTALGPDAASCAAGGGYCGHSAGKALGTLRCAARNFARCGAVALRIWIDHAAVLPDRVSSAASVPAGYCGAAGCVGGAAAHQHNTRKTKKSLKPDSLDPEEGDGPLSCGAAMLLEPSAFVPVMRIRVAPSGRKIRMRQARPRR